LTIELILGWADDYRRTYGFWPTHKSGNVTGLPGETWATVDYALRKGRGGLPGGSSLSEELRNHRKARGSADTLTEDQIFAWARAHFRRTKHWPGLASGGIPQSQGLTWARIDNALLRGLRGLPGDSNLRKLLASRGIVLPFKPRRPALRSWQIWKWAREHRRRTGVWPDYNSGSIPGSDETWLKIHGALNSGCRGFPGRSSLKKFLISRGAHPTRRSKIPRLSNQLILDLADAYFEKHGDWPYPDSGRVPGIQRLTWKKINSSLRQGSRGLSGGSSLCQLLREHGRLNFTGSNRPRALSGRKKRVMRR
jgi:hypothetical protein